MRAEPKIPGVRLIQHITHKDNRGSFTKLFQPADFNWTNTEYFKTREGFISWSSPGVIRGMHFQSPPADLDKLVSCLAGRVLDVVLDLRHSSPTYGQAIGFELSGEKPSSILIPKGCAHGFMVLGEAHALLHYAVSAEYSPSADCGVRWDSFSFNWPITSKLVVSERDQSLPAFADLPKLFL